MAKQPRYKRLAGDPATLPYAARTGLRRRQRRWALALRAGGVLLLGLAAALLLRDTVFRGGQPAPPGPPSVSGAAPAPVTVVPATADLTKDPLAAEPAPDTAPRPTAVPRTEADILPQYRELYAQNPDLVGWLRVDGTDIDYPVVQVPGDNTAYLRRGFDGLYAGGGTLFIDGRCRLGLAEGETPTANWLLYGHNMAGGSMFGTLDRYAEADFCAEHPTFTFDTLYAPGTWRVAAVLRTELGADELPYYAFFDAADRAAWQTWMDALLPQALYDTGVTPQYGDQLLTLSTCGDTAPGTRARLAVLAVRIG